MFFSSAEVIHMTERNRRIFVSRVLVAPTVLLADKRVASAPPTGARLRFCAFDLRHVTIEAGPAWPELYDVIERRVMGYLCEGLSVTRSESRPRDARPRVYGLGIPCRPESVGIPRADLRARRTLERGREKENIDALRRDFQTLEEWLAA